MWSKASDIQGQAYSPPFVIVNRRTQAKPNGDFVPAAEISLGRATVTSGLLADLSPRDLRTLLAVLSLVNANGRVRASTHEVAVALRVPVLVAFTLLVSLGLRKWRGHPLIVRVDSGEMLPTYVPSGMLLGQRLSPPEEIPGPVTRSMPLAGREAVIAESRSSYARPRAEVERELEIMHGWTLPQEHEAFRDASREPEPRLEGHERHVRQRMVKLGIDMRMADDLLRRYGTDRCVRQIAWLPFRKAKQPAKLLVTAIQQDFPIPAAAMPPSPAAPDRSSI